MDKMRWDGQQAFRQKPYNPWMINNTMVGLMRNVKNLFFLRVKNAGHRVPMDQPMVASEMLRLFIWGGWGPGIDEPIKDAKTSQLNSLDNPHNFFYL